VKRILYSRQGREGTHRAYCENGRDRVRVSDHENGSGRGRARGRDRAHGSEFPHAHGHSLGGRAYRRGCARDGYDRHDPRVNRHVSADDHDRSHSGSWMIREIGS
jgi:hypothetical protein